MKGHFGQIGGPSESANILMDSIRLDYIYTGEVDDFFTTIDAYDESLYLYQPGATHSWIAFATELLEDRPNLQNQIIGNLYDNGLQFNPNYRDAKGRNELMIIADNYGFGGVRRALEQGITPDLKAQDNAGKTAAEYVAEAAGPRGVALVKEYARHQLCENVTNKLAIGFSVVAGGSTAVLSRHTLPAVAAAAGAGILVKAAGDKVNGSIHDRTVDTIINPANDYRKLGM